MSLIGQYLLSVIAAALLCSVSNCLVEKKSATGSVIRLLTGLILATVIVAPWTNFNLSDVSDYFIAAQVDASEIADQGEQLAKSEIQILIKEQTQAYILDKASALGLDVYVEVMVSGDTPPVLQSVTITGNTSFYAKKRLTQIIRDDLGITEEHQIWS